MLITNKVTQVFTFSNSRAGEFPKRRKLRHRPRLRRAHYCDVTVVHQRGVHDDGQRHRGGLVAEEEAPARLPWRPKVLSCELQRKREIVPARQQRPRRRVPGKPRVHDAQPLSGSVARQRRKQPSVKFVQSFYIFS